MYSRNTLHSTLVQKRAISTHARHNATRSNHFPQRSRIPQQRTAARPLLHVRWQQPSAEANDRFANRQFIKNWRYTFPEGVPPPLPRNSWLVYRWDGLGNSVARWPAASQEQSAPWPFDMLSAPARLNRRIKFIKTLMRKSLEALAFAHEAGVTNTVTIHVRIQTRDVNESTLPFTPNSPHHPSAFPRLCIGPSAPVPCCSVASTNETWGLCT